MNSVRAPSLRESPKPHLDQPPRGWVPYRGWWITYDPPTILAILEDRKALVEAGKNVVAAFLGATLSSEQKAAIAALFAAIARVEGGEPAAGIQGDGGQPS